MKLRMALAQVNFTVGDIRGNVARILRWTEKAGRVGADIVAFPELAISGYPPEDLLLRPRFLGDCRAAVQRIAGKVDRPAVVVGFPNLLDSVYNSAAILARGKIAAIYNKIHLPNYGVFDEKRYFAPGDRVCVVSLGGVRVGVSICEDIWYEDVSQAQVASGGAHVILNISCSPYHAGKGAEREGLMIDRATTNGAHVAYLNLVGGQDELVFDGHSVIIDPTGGVSARGKQFDEDLITADIEVGRGGDRLRKRSRQRRCSIPVEAIKISSRSGLRKPEIAAGMARPLGRLEEIYKAIVTGTRDYVRKNGFRKVIIGLSGGVDSALVAAVAVDALGRDRVTGVSMPSQFSSRGSITDARSLARSLGIKLLRVDIGGLYDAYGKSLKPLFKGLSSDETEENIQARIRGNILMALSNKFGWLVLTTGNKSELAVGYCTLYGDLAGGFAILKDVPKTLVYELARYRNSGRRPLIPEAILTKPPSAELKPDQRDADSLPPYEVLDPVLDMYVVEDMSVDEIVERGYPRKLVREVVALVDGNEYKRRQGPPGIRITPKAFGKDRRMPITNRYR
jgi:NAD+ synthase (glutamine-hydrolysing)